MELKQCMSGPGGMTPYHGQLAPDAEAGERRERCIGEKNLWMDEDRSFINEEVKFA